MAELLTSKISIKKSLLLNELSSFKRLSKVNYLNKPAHLVVFPDHIEISLPGIFRVLNATADGLYDIYLPLAILKSYAETSVQKELTFHISTGQIRCGSSEFAHSAIKVECLLSELEMSLPLNATDKDYLRLAHVKDFSCDEGELQKIAQAEKRLKKNIGTALMPLKEYGVTAKELEKFIIDKVIENNRPLS